MYIDSYIYMDIKYSIGGKIMNVRTAESLGTCDRSRQLHPEQFEDSNQYHKWSCAGWRRTIAALLGLPEDMSVEEIKALLASAHGAPEPERKEEIPMRGPMTCPCCGDEESDTWLTYQRIKKQVKDTKQLPHGFGR